MLILQLTFLRRINDAVKLSQIKIELERIEIRIQFRDRWVLKLIPEMIFYCSFESPLFRDIPPQGER